MKIAIATVQVPFINGGAELMTFGLCQAIRDAGHDVEVVTLPFKFSPASSVLANMEMWRQQNFEAFDCGKIDHVIALKFPAYGLSHPQKTIWLMHQHRSVYELFDTDFGEKSENQDACKLRNEVINFDTSALSGAEAVFTISRTVSDRLLKYNGVVSTPLYQPPPGDVLFQSGDSFPYIFCPSRLESLKRQDLLIKAMQKVAEPVVAIIAGEGGCKNYLTKMVADLGLEQRIKFVGRVDDNVMRRYYSNALGVYFGPHAEDYGFITLEAMLSSKPVITCTDSGGPTEFVLHEETGYVVEPSSDAIADSINKLWSNLAHSKEMGFNGLNRYRSLEISWSNVVNKLLVAK